MRALVLARFVDNNALNPAIEHCGPEDFCWTSTGGCYAVIALGEGRRAIDLGTLKEE